MRACMMFKECANDTRDIIMKAKQMLVVLFFIGQWLFCYTAQTFATLQFVAFIIIISYLYVLNIFFFVCRLFFTFCLVTWVWTLSYRADKVMNKSTSQKHYCVFMAVFVFEIYCITQYVHIHSTCICNSIYHNLRYYNFIWLR